MVGAIPFGRTEILAAGHAADSDPALLQERYQPILRLGNHQHGPVDWFDRWLRLDRYSAAEDQDDDDGRDGCSTLP